MYLYETKKYHSKFRIMEIEEKYELLEDLEIHYIELKKFDDMKDIEEMDELEKWLTFIKNAGEEGKEGRIEKIRKKDEVIDMAGKMLEKLSANERARQMYLAREKALLDQISAKKYQEIMLQCAKEKAKEEGKKEGIKQGIMEGIKEGKYEVVKNLIKMGVDLKIIADGAGISYEEVMKIKEKAEKEKH
ncbi:Rpn family recombination-promoting nuclease/putative transposase [Caminicella sporogenes]|nr:Rpn family recombination-promoting nuclease/putative transposase [Caminicella sporogenes]WIF96223.1 Rpn family recombination-promoting nuclease/putative transposase [Caminicella sporogenes]